MKTKIIPFDAKMAMAIQDGRIKGKIKQRHGEEVEILCWDLEKPNQLAVKHRFYDCDCKDLGIHVDEYNIRGEYFDRSDNMDQHDLVLEVPDEPQFQPFDKVLVRDNDDREWCADFYSHFSNGMYQCVSCVWNQCIPYEGNQELVGTTKKPKED